MARERKHLLISKLGMASPTPLPSAVVEAIGEALADEDFHVRAMGGLIAGILRDPRLEPLLLDASWTETHPYALAYIDQSLAIYGVSPHPFDAFEAAVERALGDLER